MPDVKIVDTGGLSAVPTYRWQTDAGASDILAGVPCKITASGSPYATVALDGDFTLGTDVQILGIAASDSTHTATADGVVDIYIPFPWIVYEALATTSTNVNTVAKINALCGDKVTFDVATGGVTTIDENAGDAVANALLIIGGDPDKGTLKFMMQTTQNAVNGA